jgi:hypothetical protein
MRECSRRSLLNLATNRSSPPHRFALMNDKMGGDLEKIKVVGQYLIEVWSAAGMDMSGGKVVFKWASDEITSNAATYCPPYP